MLIPSDTESETSTDSLYSAFDLDDLDGTFLRLADSSTRNARLVERLARSNAHCLPDVDIAIDSRCWRS